MSAWQAAGYPVSSPKPVASRAPRIMGGKELYAQHCATCHQLDGRGMPGDYPALEGNGLVAMRDPRALILVTLEGLKPAPIPGREAPVEMPAFAGSLSDREIASILTYVRTEWGAQPTKVNPADVRALRAKP
jgi:mono/diheme cytochrome c family protein